MANKEKRKKEKKKDPKSTPEEKRKERQTGLWQRALRGSCRRGREQTTQEQEED